MDQLWNWHKHIWPCWRFAWLIQLRSHHCLWYEWAPTSVLADYLWCLLSFICQLKLLYRFCTLELCAFLLVDAMVVFTTVFLSRQLYLACPIRRSINHRSQLKHFLDRSLHRLKTLSFPTLLPESSLNDLLWSPRIWEHNLGWVFTVTTLQKLCRTRLIILGSFQLLRGGERSSGRNESITGQLVSLY